MESVFAKFIPKAYPFTYRVTLNIPVIAGATPTDPKVAEGWIKSKLVDKETLVQSAVLETMVERGVEEGEAAELVAANRNLTGFKQDANGLYLEGRCIKAAIKESACIRFPWPEFKFGGETADGKQKGKSAKSFFPEHVFVLEDRVYFGVKEATGINQRFVHSRFGSAIQYEEYIEDANLTFTLTTDYKFTNEQWALLWLTGEQQGIGASRSQGFGRYKVTEWEIQK